MKSLPMEKNPLPELDIFDGGRYIHKKTIFSIAY